MSTSIFPDFPHSLDSEPDENWTVEEVLQWNLLKSHEATNQKHEEMVNSLQNQFQQGKKELLALQADENNRVGAAAGGAFHQRSDSSNSIAKGMSATSQKAQQQQQQQPVVSMIHVTITTGPYANNTFRLSPKTNTPCWVGRSAGKKFRDRGISLAKDSEVSTTHGKFEIKKGDAYFIDVGSTNGTLVKGVLLEPNDRLLLFNGIELVLGSSTLVIRLE